MKNTCTVWLEQCGECPFRNADTTEALDGAVTVDAYLELKDSPQLTGLSVEEIVTHAEVATTRNTESFFSVPRGAVAGAFVLVATGICER
jgi:hypothetical protein